ncbi:hypothetical protein B0H17DRAFT_1146447 [Mycena rosella]|uniref:Uncharacterized protein n=1 Tax=Mycena rosella TaxID=1033263 RepID=A0AAD7G0T9_MYCRO|nr:hypothetical protein B0H17DRAFT_1146447 [Mycena rosella]
MALGGLALLIFWTLILQIAHAFKLHSPAGFTLDPKVADAIFALLGVNRGEFYLLQCSNARHDIQILFHQLHSGIDGRKFLELAATSISGTSMYKPDMPVQPQPLSLTWETRPCGHDRARALRRHTQCLRLGRSYTMRRHTGQLWLHAHAVWCKGWEPMSAMLMWWGSKWWRGDVNEGSFGGERPVGSMVLGALSRLASAGMRDVGRGACCEEGEGTNPDTDAEGRKKKPLQGTNETLVHSVQGLSGSRKGKTRRKYHKNNNHAAFKHHSSFDNFTPAPGQYWEAPRGILPEFLKLN